jgi:hypothetical protein
MRMNTLLARALVGATVTTLVGTGLTAAPAEAASTMSSRYILNHLVSGPEHSAGYDRAKFTLWDDTNGDGCDTRAEVLLAEAVIRPVAGGSCDLGSGLWLSRYDGVITKDSSTFDVDHMVPLNEAWQSGAWRWSSTKREAYANDLGYKASLIAVSAHSNRSKGDREPQDWMPERSSYACKYVKRWVAVKWRWRLTVNTAECTFLRAELQSCGWPRVARPGTPVISSPGGGGGGTVPVPVPAPSPTPSPPPTSSTGLDPRFDYCYHAIAAGYGPYYRGADPEYDWYTDADHDGVVCET